MNENGLNLRFERGLVVIVACWGFLASLGLFGYAFYQLKLENDLNRTFLEKGYTRVPVLGKPGEMWVK